MANRFLIILSSYILRKKLTEAEVSAQHSLDRLFVLCSKNTELILTEFKLKSGGQAHSKDAQCFYLLSFFMWRPSGCLQRCGKQRKDTEQNRAVVRENGYEINLIRKEELGWRWVSNWLAD